MNAFTTLASTATVRSGPGRLIGVLVTAAADAASVTLYDNTTNSGTVLAVVKAAINSTVQWLPPGGQVATIGIHAVIAGTAPSITVVYG